jgi:hypothetical protein
LGFVAADVTETVADAAFMAWLVKSQNAVVKYDYSWTSFLELARMGSASVLVLTPPGLPALDVMPTLVLPGIQKRFAHRAAKAKANPNCSESIQKKLGIFTSPDSTVHMMPNLSVKDEAGFPQVIFHRYNYVGMNLYRDTGTGYGSLPYKTLTKSPFRDIDLPEIGVTGQYKYKGIYIVNDVEIGSFSKEVSANVLGR